VRRPAAGLPTAIAVVGVAVAAVSWSFPPTASEQDGLAAFETVRVVLQHPRCQNCHIPGDAPLQFDAGVTHAMGVARGADGHGAAGLARLLRLAECARFAGADHHGVGSGEGVVLTSSAPLH